MLSVSKTANPNYLAKIVKLDNLRKHSNADRLQIATIDFQTVVTDMKANNGDLYVYFPLECIINHRLLSLTNSYRDKELNVYKTKTGFFEANRRVKATKLRGEKSMGYIVPVNQLEIFTNTSYTDWSNYIGVEFDTINGTKLLEKFEVPVDLNQSKNNSKHKKIDSRVIDGQVNLHVDTIDLRKNVNKLNLTDTISLTYKTHGTSWWVGNLLTKRKLSFLEKIAKLLGVHVVESKYDILYGSRKVIKNFAFNKGFYDYDLWSDIKDSLSNIPKGYTLYGECLGFTKQGGYIQKDYDYGNKKGEFSLEVYRITKTNQDGLVTELSYPQIVEFCKKTNLNPSHRFYHGSLENYLIENKISLDNWHTNFIKHLEERYNNHKCFMCNNDVPEEGIVLRVESLFNCNSYKLKSFDFLQKESKQLDQESLAKN